jgi:O-antigen ligase
LGTLARSATGGQRASVVAFLVLLVALPVAYAATRQPLEVLVGVVALVAVVLCMLRIEFAVLALVASAPLEFVIRFGSGSLTVTKVAGVVCFGAFALNAIVTRRRLVFDIAHGLVFLLLAIAAVSMLQAEDLPASIVVTTRYASFVALFFVVSQFVGDWKLQRRIAWTLSLGSCITGIVASWNFLSGTTFAANVSSGGGGGPGDIAFILATTLPFTMWLLSERGFRRAAALAMTVVIAVSIVFTFNRGALLGLGAGLLWYTVFERRNGRALLAGALAIGLALFIVVRLNQQTIETGLQSKEKVATTNVQTRLEAWNAAARLAVTHPVLGVGPGNFEDRYLRATGHPPGTKTLRVVHNAYLDVAAELGIAAVALFIAYLVLGFARLTTAVRDRLGPPGFASAARVSLVIAVFAAITLSEQYFAPFWLLGGLAAALVHERDLASAEP